MSLNPSSPPSMRQMAAELGVSLSTVSLALRNDPRVAAATRERVQTHAGERGYRLNPAMTGMMSRARRSRRADYRETLGWINTWDHPDYFTRRGVDYQCELWRGAEARAVSLGYRLDSFWQGDPKMSGERLSRVLISRGIRGLLITPLPRPVGHISLQWDHFSAVSLSLTLSRPRLPCVVPDHYMNMRLILRNLRHRGYRRIGLLLREGYDERMDNRLSSAFYHSQQPLRTRDRIPVLQVADKGVEDATIVKWLLRHRPDAVITMGDLRQLRGLDVGDPEYSSRLGVVLIGLAETDCGFTAVNENPYRIGMTAIDQLVTALNLNQRGLPDSPAITLIRGSWVEGDTLPTAREPV